jgi:hypothetical protein
MVRGGGPWRRGRRHGLRARPFLPRYLAPQSTCPFPGLPPSQHAPTFSDQQVLGSASRPSPLERTALGWITVRGRWGGPWQGTRPRERCPPSLARAAACTCCSPPAPSGPRPVPTHARRTWASWRRHCCRRWERTWAASGRLRERCGTRQVRGGLAAAAARASPPRPCPALTLPPRPPPRQGLSAPYPSGPSGPTEAAAAGSPGGPPALSAVGGGGWRDFLEVGAFADYLLATELYKNPDGYRGWGDGREREGWGLRRTSTRRRRGQLHPPAHSLSPCLHLRSSIYMSKNVGSPIAFGPPWVRSGPRARRPARLAAIRAPPPNPLPAQPLQDLNEAFGECCGYPIAGFDRCSRSLPAPQPRCTPQPPPEHAPKLPAASPVPGPRPSSAAAIPAAPRADPPSPPTAGASSYARSPCGGARVAQRSTAQQRGPACDAAARPPPCVLPLRGPGPRAFPYKHHSIAVPFTPPSFALPAARRTLWTGCRSTIAPRGGCGGSRPLLGLAP